jgi:small subunit ribosomal protein S4
MGFRVGKIEDVLGLKLDDLMSRRLQTVVWKRGLASTPKQARQMIVHRHITVGDRVVRWPSYIVLAEEDDKISVSPKMKPKVVGAEAPTGALL